MYKTVLNAANIYDTIFLNVIGVTEYSTINDLIDDDISKYKEWVKFAIDKYGEKHYSSFDENDFYIENACKYPEFSKIITITFCTIHSEDGNLIRKFKKIIDQDEQVLLQKFIDEFAEFHKNSIYASPKFDYTLCGYDIMNSDIPFVIKRLLLHKQNIEYANHLIPAIIKTSLNAKPWDDVIIDTKNLWKFNGLKSTPLNLISKSLNLKTTVDLMSPVEINVFYHTPDDEIDIEKKTSILALQSANIVNLSIQMLTYLRNV